MQLPPFLPFLKYAIYNTHVRNNWHDQILGFFILLFRIRTTVVVNWRRGNRQLLVVVAVVLVIVVVVGIAVVVIVGGGHGGRLIAGLVGGHRPGPDRFIVAAGRR